MRPSWLIDFLFIVKFTISRALAKVFPKIDRGTGVFNTVRTRSCPVSRLELLHARPALYEKNLQQPFPRSTFPRNFCNQADRLRGDVVHSAV